MTAAEWNERYPPGTHVAYYPERGNRLFCVDTKTRSKAWTLPSGDAVVKIVGRPGGVFLGNLEVRSDQ